MSKYAYHRIDSNAEALYAFLEAHGATVKRIGTPLDALVCYRRVTGLVEVKTLKGQLRHSQVKFIEEWPGLAMVLRTEEDCRALLFALSEIADYGVGDPVTG